MRWKIFSNNCWRRVHRSPPNSQSGESICVARNANGFTPHPMSKLSLHISDWLDPDIAFDFIGDTRPPVVKVFGNVGLNDTKIAASKQRSPSTLFVGRMYFPEQGIEKDETTP